jgi:hypothetical protein
MQTLLKYRAKSASNLRPSHVLSFLLGVTLMLAFSKLGASNPQPPSHVYELRLYHAREGKMDALKARFRDHTDALFRQHNMTSIGYWSPQDAPDSQNLFILYSGASQPAGSGEELGCFPSRFGMEQGKGGIGSERTSS